jgi:hypothetical protein
MLARPYHFSDTPSLDRLCEHQGITDPRLDHIVVVGDLGAPSGVLVYRPGAFVHELECGGSRLRAEALSNFAIGQARAQGLHTAIFLIRAGNERMMRFAENLGAVKQTDPGDVLYTLTP